MGHGRSILSVLDDVPERYVSSNSDYNNQREFLCARCGIAVTEMSETQEPGSADMDPDDHLPMQSSERSISKMDPIRSEPILDYAFPKQTSRHSLSRIVSVQAELAERNLEVIFLR